MIKKDIERIADRHIHNVDKYYRMLAGLSSHLKAYEDGTIFLTIHVNKKWKKENEVTAKQMATSWKTCNTELSKATRYEVTIIRNEAPTGAFLTAGEVQKGGAIRRLIAMVKRIPGMDELNKSENKVIICGHLDEDELDAELKKDRDEIRVTSIPKWTACITIGLNRGYSNKTIGKDRVKTWLKEIQKIQIERDQLRLSANIIPSTVVLAGHDEQHLNIHFINYPRFPETAERLRKGVDEIARFLMNRMEQNRIVITYDQELVMMDKTDEVSIK